MKKTRKLALPLALTLSLAASSAAWAHGEKPAGAPVVKEQKAWGIAGDAKSARRTIVVRMTDDMKFSPSHIEVTEGETIRFDVRNAGKVMHEFVIGTQKELDEHAALMLRHPGMEHDEPYMAHVKPAGRAPLVWNFNRAGEFQFACLIAGHFQAGMKGTITVRKKP